MRIDTSAIQAGATSKDQNSTITSTAETAIRLRSVGKTYRDGLVALHNISLAVQPGEFVSIVGPSGCGKSTLLRIASGLTLATSGKVERPVAQDIGCVFQDPTLLPWRTVDGNVKLLCELRRMPKNERNRLAHEALEVVGLSGFKKHRPGALSGGMRMRLALARALTINPRLFLFDEPFGMLDEITRQHLNEHVRSLFLEKRFAAILVTHSVSEAVYLSSRVLVMSSRPGKLHAEFRVPDVPPSIEDRRFGPRFVAIASEVSKALRDGNS